MFDFKIYRDPDRESRGVQCLTFSVDGQMSGKWFHKCSVEGLGENYYIERCINRLKEGRSSEAFGGPVAVNGTQSRGTDKLRGEVKMVSPKAAKKGEDQETRPQYAAIVDGEEVGVFPTEKQARMACAIRAFMTRGKLGRLKEAEEAFEAEHGKKGKATYDGKSFRMKTTRGNEEYVIGFGDEGITFKQIVKPSEESPSTRTRKREESPEE